MKAHILILSLCMMALSVGCDKGYEEIREGRTADVYVCGTWLPEQIEHIDEGIADINAKITLVTGVDPFRLAGILEDDTVYDESDIGDGRHCIYRVYDGYPSAYGQNLWQTYTVEQDKAGLLDEDDDIVLFSNTPDGSCHIPGTPPDWPCTWMIQGIVEHELGHAFGLDHADEGSGQNMASRHESVTWTVADVEDACRVRDCL